MSQRVAMSAVCTRTKGARDAITHTWPRPKRAVVVPRSWPPLPVARASESGFGLGFGLGRAESVRRLAESNLRLPERAHVPVPRRGAARRPCPAARSCSVQRSARRFAAGNNSTSSTDPCAAPRQARGVVRNTMLRRLLGLAAGVNAASDDSWHTGRRRSGSKKTF